MIDPQPFFFKKKSNPPGETPAFIEICSTGILTSSNSSGSWGRVSQVFDSCGSFGGKCPGVTSRKGKPELVYGTLRYKLSGTNWLSFGGFKEQPCVVEGVIICVSIIVVQ